MNPDPYKTPQTPIRDSAEPPPAPLRGFLTGLALDIAGTVVFSVLFSIGYAVWLTASGLKPDEVRQVLEHLGPDSAAGLFLAVMGCGFSVLGGYACARIAHSRDYRLGGLLAATSTGLGMLMAGPSQADDQAVLMAVLMALLSIGALLLGTHLGLRRDAPAPPPAA